MKSTPNLAQVAWGEVYLARDRELERMVAIKVLPIEAALDRGRMNRFIQRS